MKMLRWLWQAVLLYLAGANLLDWRLNIGYSQQFYCSPDYCHVPMNWTVTYPVLIIDHEWGLHIEMFYDLPVNNSELCATLISAGCNVQSEIKTVFGAETNATQVHIPIKNDWKTLCWPIQSADKLSFHMDTSNCTLALSDLFFRTPSVVASSSEQDSSGSSRVELSEERIRTELLIILLALLVVFVLAVAVAICLSLKRCRYQPAFDHEQSVSIEMN